LRRGIRGLPARRSRPGGLDTGRRGRAPGASTPAAAGARRGPRHRSGRRGRRRPGGRSA